MKEASCILCGRESDRGLHLFQSVICPSCERRILTADAGDAQYAAFMSKLQTVTKKIPRA